jgi:hypothetical protein
MKKLTFILLAPFLTLAMANGANGQSNFATADDKVITLSSSFENEARSSMDIDIRAIRNFKKEFPDVTNDVWTKIKEGYFVGFSVNGIQSKLFLSKNGTCLGHIRYYSEKDLPAAVRHQVKSMYYDFSIFNVTEATAAGNTVYLITLEDNVSWKTVRVADGEMSVLKQYKKG